MTRETQMQRAGSDATQFQAGRDIVVNTGLSAADAVIIAEHSGRSAAELYTREAMIAVEKKIAQLSEKLVARFSQHDLLETFADPSFQRTLRQAQVGAAATDREEDIDLLVELLEARADSKDSRPLRASISRSIEIVDEIDGVALDGLTTVYAALTWRPVSPSVLEGLGVLDNLYRQLLVDQMPSGYSWIEHLEVLGAIRTSPLGSRRNLIDLWAIDALGGYVAKGLDAKTIPDAEHFELVPGAPTLPLVAHELKPGFLRVAYANLDNLVETVEASGLSELSAEYASRAKSELGFDSPDLEAVAKLGEAIPSFSALAALQGWFDQIPTAFNITPIGRILAVSNAKRRDTARLLPELSFE